MRSETRHFLDVIIKAGLEGKPQIRGRFHDGKNGDCVLGIWYKDARSENAPFNDGEKLTAPVICPNGQMPQLYLRSAAMCLNDCYGLDFIGIARKLESLLEP